MKRIPFVMLTVMLFNSGFVVSQETASESASDPASNRLFLMSTGQTMSRGRFSVVDHEVVFMGIGYAPTGFLQFNAVAFPWFLSGTKDQDHSFWMMGTKLQLIHSEGFLRGVALGADIINPGFDNTYEVRPAGDALYLSSSPARFISLNVAASIGFELTKAHLNIASIPPPTNAVGSTTIFQFGFESILHIRDNGAGTKLMVETWSNLDRQSSLEVSTLLIGFRLYSRNSAIEFAWPFFRIRKSLEAMSFPYASMNFFF